MNQNKEKGLLELLGGLFYNNMKKILPKVFP